MAKAKAKPKAKAKKSKYAGTSRKKGAWWFIKLNVDHPYIHNSVSEGCLVKSKSSKKKPSKDNEESENTSKYAGKTWAAKKPKTSKYAGKSRQLR